MVVFVLGLETGQDGDCIFDRRLLHLDRLETALESGVLFDVLAVFGQRRGTHDLQLSTAESRLEDIRGIHGSLGRACPHDGVQLINEQDDILGLLDFVHHGLDPLLELASVLGARHHQREIQSDHPLGSQQLGHIALSDFLGQPLHDGCFTHTGLTQQHRVVLGAATEDLDDPLDLIAAADHRIHIALLGDLGEVATEGLESGRLLILVLVAAGRTLTSLNGFGRGLLFATLFLAGLELRVQLLQNFLAALLDVDL